MDIDRTRTIKIHALVASGPLGAFVISDLEEQRTAGALRIVPFDGREIAWNESGYGYCW